MMEDFNAFLDRKQDQLAIDLKEISLTKEEQKLLELLPPEVEEIIAEELGKYRVASKYDIRQRLTYKAIASVLKNLPVYKDVIEETYSNAEDIIAQ